MDAEYVRTCVMHRPCSIQQLTGKGTAQADNPGRQNGGPSSRSVKSYSLPLIISTWLGSSDNVHNKRTKTWQKETSDSLFTCLGNRNIIACIP
jgi:hypothetical protein